MKKISALSLLVFAGLIILIPAIAVAGSPNKAFGTSLLAANDESVVYLPITMNGSGGDVENRPPMAALLCSRRVAFG